MNLKEAVDSGRLEGFIWHVIQGSSWFVMGCPWNWNPVAAVALLLHSAETSSRSIGNISARQNRTITLLP